MPTPLPVIAGVYYCYLHGLNGGLTTGITLAFRATELPVGPAQDSTWAQVIADSLPHQWNLTMGPLYPSTVAGWDSKVYPLGSPTEPAAVGHETGAGAEAAVLAAAPSAAVIRHAVRRRGRGSQSHTAISPLARVQVDDDGQRVADSWILTFTTEFENFIGGVQADFTAGVSGNTIDYVQLSKKGAGATYEITRTYCEPILGSERSRTLRP